MLEIKGLVKDYGDFRLNCSMKVGKGCITGLVGQNGAGKSTTFKAALGLISCDSGEVSILGKPSSELTARDRQKMGVALNNSGFSGYLRVKDIVPVLRAMYPEFDEGKFKNICRKFSVPENKMIKDFSTGMKAKLKVIVAVTHNAEFLLLDEPTSGLDVVTRRDVMDLLREYMEENEDRSILISSHISTDLEGLCDDIYMIHNGQIVLHEDTDVLLNNYALIKADREQFARLDKEHILKVRREHYGYDCLTNQKQYYRENYPDVVVERGNLDEVIAMMIGGEDL
ncbi:MAG TPA: ABC transporter ATP-binding protein [Candidatus Mediterraneibacter avicola]|nr:ABC transporter ATP-binding protein [Candidatus Mediterraneibacter avicola]